MFSPAIRGKVDGRSVCRSYLNIREEDKEYRGKEEHYILSDFLNKSPDLDDILQDTPKKIA
jgi:hypothetical protein